MATAKYAYVSEHSLTMQTGGGTGAPERRFNIDTRREQRRVSRGWFLNSKPRGPVPLDSRFQRPLNNSSLGTISGSPDVLSSRQPPPTDSRSGAGMTVAQRSLVTGMTGFGAVLRVDGESDVENCRAEYGPTLERGLLKEALQARRFDRVTSAWKPVAAP